MSDVVLDGVPDLPERYRVSKKKKLSSRPEEKFSKQILSEIVSMKVYPFRNKLSMFTTQLDVWTLPW